MKRMRRCLICRRKRSRINLCKNKKKRRKWQLIWIRKLKKVKIREIVRKDPARYAISVRIKRRVCLNYSFVRHWKIILVTMSNMIFWSVNLVPKQMKTAAGWLTSVASKNSISKKIQKNGSVIAVSVSIKSSKNIWPNKCTEKKKKNAKKNKKKEIKKK